MNYFLKQQKIGFLGAGNMTQALVKGLIESKTVPAQNILIANRTPGKVLKLHELYGTHSCQSNEELIENSDIVVLATKPQDLLGAIEPLSQFFHETQICISLAAGIRLKVLEKYLPNCRMARVMPNTPSLIGRGVLGYFTSPKFPELDVLVEDLLTPLGLVQKVDDEEQFEALMIGCSSGTGFVFELMMYWQEWLEEHDFEPEIAKKMVIETFLGTSMLAAQSGETPLADLQAKVASKKGVTGAGLQSMREIEIERALRISFEKAAMRSQEMSRDFK